MSTTNPSATDETMLNVAGIVVTSSNASLGSSYLTSLEDAMALELLPSLVIMGLMSLLGNAGNGLVLYVYYTRFSPSSTRTYILAMSVVDMLFNCVSLPGEMLDLRFSLTYNAVWLCSMHRLLSVLLTVTSGFLLVVVALVRRRKICHPFRPALTHQRVRLSVVVCVVLALVVSVPFGMMNGRHSVPTEVPGLVGAACSVDDRFIDTLFPLVYNLVLLVVFLACAVTMSVSYAQIARRIVKHRRRSLGDHEDAAKKVALAIAPMNLDNGGTDSSSQHEHRHRLFSKTESSSHYEEERACHAHSAQRPNGHQRLSMFEKKLLRRKSDRIGDKVDPTPLLNMAESTAAAPPEKPRRVVDQMEDEVFAPEAVGQRTADPRQTGHTEQGTGAAARLTTDAAVHADDTGPAPPSTPTPEAPLPPCPHPQGQRTTSTEESERRLAVAIRTLVHAVSDDALRSSDLASLLPRPLSVHRRSASVGDKSAGAVSNPFLPPPTASRQSLREQPRQPGTADVIVDQELPSQRQQHTTREKTESVEQSQEQDAVAENERNSKSKKHYAPNNTYNTQSDTQNDIHNDIHNDSKISTQIDTPNETQNDTSNDAPNLSLKHATNDAQNNRHDDVTLSDDHGDTEGHHRPDAGPHDGPKGSLSSSHARLERLCSSISNTLRRTRSLRRGDSGKVAGDGGTLRRRHTGKRIPSRTTWMMFVLTAIFVISYLPYLTIISVRAASNDIEVGLSGFSLNLYTLTLRSYFINSVVNPLVYSFCSARFRLQCRNLFSRGKKMSVSS